MERSAISTKAEPWFWDWLNRAWPWAYKLLETVHLRSVIEWSSVAATALTTIGLSLTLLRPKQHQHLLFIGNDIGHLLLVSAALLFFIPRLEAGKPRLAIDSDNVRRRLHLFKAAFTTQLLFWLSLYGTKSISDLPVAFPNHFHAWSAEHQSLLGHALFGLNLLSSFSLIVMYRSLGRGSRTTFLQGFTTYVLVAIACIAAILFRVSDALGALAGSTAVLAPGLVNGIISGTSLSLLIGRLDSRYIGISSSTIVLLYIYALIQPLYPIVFPDVTPLGVITDADLRIQQFFVALALFMKAVFIVQVGRLVDSGRLDFYLTSMSWLERHIDQLRIHHDIARKTENEPDGGPPLYAFSYPGTDHAVVRLSNGAVRVELSLVNAWLGVVWDVRRFSIGGLSISSVPFGVVRTEANESPRVGKDGTVTKVKLHFDLGLTPREFAQQLISIPALSEAAARREKRLRLELGLSRLRAEMKVVDDRHANYVWCSIEPVISRDALSYQVEVDPSEVADILV